MPSCAFEFAPQHFTSPALVTAHECVDVAPRAEETSTTPVVSPVTSTPERRLSLGDEPPSPKAPMKSDPKHLTPPPLVRAQYVVFGEPPLIFTTFERPEIDTGVHCGTAASKNGAPQHFTLPESVTAQLETKPATMSLTPLARPVTPTGASRRVLVPSPTCPSPFIPQHLTLPSLVSTQPEAEVGCTFPAIFATLPDDPWISTGVARLVCVPSPSWLKKFPPQHFASPDAVRTQAESRPSSISTMLLGNPETKVESGWGVIEIAGVPVGGNPAALPQHLIDPSLMKAQLAKGEDLISMTSVKPATVAGIAE